MITSVYLAALLLHLGTQQALVGIMRAGQTRLAIGVGPHGNRGLSRTLPVTVNQQDILAAQCAGEGELQRQGGLAGPTLRAADGQDHPQWFRRCILSGLGRPAMVSQRRSIAGGGLLKPERMAGRGVASGLWRLVGLAMVGPMLVVLAVYAWLFVGSMARHGWTREHFTALLLLWQTQTAAALALVAALIGSALILHQTQAVERRAEERRNRRARALLAILPLALTELADYAVSCSQTILAVLRTDNTDGSAQVGLDGSRPPPPWTWPPDMQLPPLPAGLSDRFVELIETSEPDHAKPLIKLAQHLQIQHARAQALWRDIWPFVNREHLVTRANVLSCIVDAAEAFAWCEVLFSYARGDAEKPAATISANHVKKALPLMCRTIPFEIAGPVIEELEKEIDLQAKAGRWTYS